MELNGASLKFEQDIQGTLRSFFRSASAIFDAVMLPLRVPAQDSYAWILIKDRAILEEAVPIAPIMHVNAAQALKRLTRKGEGKFKVAVLMRPCEVRAAIELTKLNQIQLNDITICSYDCPGALPMQEYLKAPEEGEAKFYRILEEGLWNSPDTKAVCRMCDKFYLPASDLHFAFQQGKVAALAQSEKGKAVLQRLNLQSDLPLADWNQEKEEIRQVRLAAREQSFGEIRKKVEGFENLLDTFSACIGCHNCQSVCPICYCRQCYFSSATAKPNTDVLLLRAEKRGGFSLPLDRLMFHTGRMAHMSLSCVSCGLCSDACPVDIPVATIFSYVGSQTQQAFEYTAGESLGDALPMKEYQSEELAELKILLSAGGSLEDADE